MQTRSYDQYLTRVAGMIGMPVSGMTTDELGFLNAYFNNNTRNMWQLNNWIDVCPYGEARFVGNVLHYTNDISQTTYWTTTNGTVTRNNLTNPLDGRTTACKFLETTATGAHSETQTFTPTPGASYIFSTYARPISGRYLYLACNDGVTTYSAFFNLAAGTVGTQANLSTGASIQLQANGFYLCTINFAASASATTSGTVTLQTSSDGSTLSFAGSATAGLYLWGNLLQQTTLVAANAFIIPWEQEGETVIEAIFQVFRSNPSAPPYPVMQSFTIVPDGLQLISGSGWNTNYYGYAPNFAVPITNPVFLYYRKEPTDYLGAAYSSSTAYAASTTVLFTNTTTLVQDFYTSNIATSAGQSPSNTAANWDINAIPEFLFQYACYMGYADWLKQDGQFDKALAQENSAQKQMDDESDRQERQMGKVLPFIVSTHTSSQPRY